MLFSDAVNADEEKKIYFMSTQGKSSEQLPLKKRTAAYAAITIVVDKSIKWPVLRIRAIECESNNQMVNVSLL